MSEPSRQSPSASHSRGHEQRDISLRPIVLASVGLAVLILVAVVAMRSLFGFYLAREMRESPAANPLAVAEGERLPPEPRLQPQPIEQLRALRAREDVVLQTYGWIDRDQGIVRIPIERAMELIIERGVAVAETVEAVAEPAPAEQAGGEVNTE